MRFQKKDISKLPLRHSYIIEGVISIILKTILRYLFMSAYVVACNELALYARTGFVTKAVVTVSAICASRWVLREIGRMISNGMDEPWFEDVGIVACIRGIKNLISRWG